jgi:hypothetical protein
MAWTYLLRRGLPRGVVGWFTLLSPSLVFSPRGESRSSDVRGAFNQHRAITGLGLLQDQDWDGN